MKEFKEIEEQIVNNSLIYFRKNYPNKTLHLEGYGQLGYDALSNKGDLLSIVDNYSIKCAYCKKKLNNKDSWIVIFHNTKDPKKDIEVLMFCYSEGKICSIKYLEDYEERKKCQE